MKTSKRRVQQFCAAFLITGILILALCGFVLVDLSTERYMPTSYVPMFLVTGADEEGVLFSALGEDYLIAAEQFGPLEEFLWENRGLLPHSVTQAGYLTAKGWVAVQGYLEGAQEPQEPW